MSRISIILLILLFYSSCKRTNDNVQEADRKFENATLSVSESLNTLPTVSNDSMITIKVPEDFGTTDQFIEVSKIFDSIRYVPLETSSQCIISSIEKSIIYQDKIYILDSFGKSIFVFSKDGKFIRRIGRHGHGPEEYNEPHTIDIDEVNQYLYVYDDTPNKFLIFDLQGNFIREEKVNFRLNDFEILNDSTFVVSTDARVNFHLPAIANNKLVMTNRSWKIFAKGMEYDAKNSNQILFSRSGLYKTNGKILYNPTLSYFIYTVSLEGLIPKYFIDAGSAMLPAGFDYKLSLDDFFNRYDKANRFTYITGPILENENCLVTTLRYQEQPVYFFYSKKSRALFCSLHLRYEAYNQTIIPDIKGMDSSGEFYSFIDPVDFNQQVEFITEYNVGKVTPAMKNIPDDNNPIFVYYTLKDF